MPGSRGAPAGAIPPATIVDARYAFLLGEVGDDVALAPLLCAGLIGWRSLVIAGAGKKLGLYGFGAAAHIIAQVAKYQGRSVFAFTRPGDVRTQTFARGLGAAWAGGSDEMPPEPLDADYTKRFVNLRDGSDGRHEGQSNHADHARRRAIAVDDKRHDHEQANREPGRARSGRRFWRKCGGHLRSPMVLPDGAGCASELAGDGMGL